MRVGVVGHVEWIDFVAVDRVPEPGQIVTAEETWGEAAGGGGVAAVQLARLADGATLFTALGGDEPGQRSRRQLERLGVRVYVEWRAQAQRRGFCYVDADGERTITLLSAKLRPRGLAPLPWDELTGFDAVYFTGGDPDERYRDGDLDPPPRLVVWTEGSNGGRYEPGGGRWDAAPLPGERADSYGAGDTFAAHLTFALAEGRKPQQAVEFAARGAAEALTRRGAHGLAP
jgi:ribokinase